MEGALRLTEELGDLDGHLVLSIKFRIELDGVGEVRSYLVSFCAFLLEGRRLKTDGGI